MNNPYQPIKAKIEKVIWETPTIKTFILRPAEPLSFLAGQFMQVTVPGWGECPFTPSSDPQATATIEFTVMKAGPVTTKLHSLVAGEEIGVRGPYGKPYPLKNYYGKDVYIVGGGVGLAPLRSLLFALFHEIDKLNKIEVRLGARTPSEIVYRTALSRWNRRKKTKIKIAVDIGAPGWQGKLGLVTTLLKESDVTINKAVAIVCGPPIMMKFVTKRLLDLGFADQDIYLSLEKNMSCGIGRCFHCSCGKYLVCHDGPVFTWAQIKDIPDPW